MISYEPEDLVKAIELYNKGYVRNEHNDENIINCAKAYYTVRQWTLEQPVE